MGLVCASIKLRSASLHLGRLTQTCARKDHAMNALARQPWAAALVAALLATSGLAAFAAEAQIPKAALAPENPAALEFLLAAAAKDFALPGSPHPTGIRRVRLGRLHEPSGPGIPILCGSFLAGGASGSAEWIPFATIQTGDYEQWVGSQAQGYCGQPVRWSQGDHAQALLERVRGKK
jgi:hypothetical protein